MKRMEEDSIMSNDNDGETSMRNDDGKPHGFHVNMPTFTDMSLESIVAETAISASEGDDDDDGGVAPIPIAVGKEADDDEPTDADRLADMGADVFTSAPEPKREPADCVVSGIPVKDTLRIATMNVLNREDSYLERMDGVLRMLIGHAHADVICFQEVRLDMANEFADMLNAHGYGFTWRRESIHNKLDTVGIAYDMRSLHAVGSGEPVYGVEALKAHLVHNADETRHLGIITYHGDWGATMQASRLRELSVLNRFSVSMSRYPVILAGDFNAQPDEKAVRYLRGETAGADERDWTYWVEAQNVREGLFGNKPFMTSLNKGLAAATAANHGIDADYFPERRIDYMFAKGFSYGKQGGFTGDASTCAGFTADDGTWVDANSLSDHRPVIASIIFKRVERHGTGGDPFADGE